MQPYAPAMSEAESSGSLPPFVEPDPPDLERPGYDEVHATMRAVCTAIAPDGRLTELQRLVMDSSVEAMTGFKFDIDALAPASPAEFATALARRNHVFRTRIVQMMVLGEMILTPLPPEVCERVTAYASAVGVDDEEMLKVAQEYAHGNLGRAMIDFQRAGYIRDFDTKDQSQLHTSRALHDAWQEVVDDPALADRWRSLGECAEGTLGREVWKFYRSRGFHWPGTVGSAPPYLAQHDWVHVIADYGTTVECELEVFGLISRAIDDPKGFSLLAMVISLFETGYLHSGAGLFEYDRGHLSARGAAVRLADGMYRGAVMVDHHLPGKDLMAMDWFRWADVPLARVRDLLGVVPKSEAALAAGSVGLWDDGALSPFQEQAGRDLAEREGYEYDSYGATVAVD